MSDSYIPEGEEPPRLGAVPVRFFGTYAFSWIESKRAIEPFDDEHMEHASNSRQPEFQRGVSEAKHFQVSSSFPTLSQLINSSMQSVRTAGNAGASVNSGCSFW